MSMQGAKSAGAGGLPIVPNAEQAKSMASWFITTFGAGIAGYIAGKGWASAAQVTSILNSPAFMSAMVWAVMTLPTLVWGLYVHTKKYATEVVNDIPEVKGVITESSPAGMALAKSIPSPTVAIAGSVMAAKVSSPMADTYPRPGQG